MMQLPQLQQQQQQFMANPFNGSQAPPQNPILSRNYPTLYVGNLEEQITEEMLYKFFCRFGHIYSIRVMRDRAIKVSRGFAYVSFYQLKDAENARVQANHEKILKQELRVTWKKSLKEVNNDANVIVKNLDESVTGQILEQEFSVYGSIFSAIVCYDINGKSRGYGYVQFDTLECANKCISQAQNLKIKEKIITVQIFQKKDSRTDIRKNIYLKNLPNQTNFPTNTIEQIKTQLDKICNAFGDIDSSVVQQDKDSNKYYAFVSFKEKEAAEACLKELKINDDPFQIGEKLYVEWHENKTTRQKQLKQQHSSSVNETNLYTKFLKLEVTPEDLKKQFEQYGEIKSCIIRKPEQTKVDKQFNTNYGFINFADKEYAKKAFKEAKDSVEINKLYEQQVYLNYFIKKDQWKQFQDAKSRYKKTSQPNFQQLVFDPFFLMQQMGPQMMMNKNAYQQFNGGRGAPFQQNGGFMPMPPQPFNQQQFNGFQQGQMPRQQQVQQQFQNQVNFNKNQQQQRQFDRQQQQPFKHKQMNQVRNKTNNYNNGQRNVTQQDNNQYQNQQKPVQQQQQQQQQVQQQVQQTTQKFTQQNLKENLPQFLKLEKEQQRTILGELLFPSVVKHAKTEALAPKITGMLIDFEVFEIAEIIEFLESEENLKERVLEAEELINQGESQN